MSKVTALILSVVFMLSLSPVLAQDIDQLNEQAESLQSDIGTEIIIGDNAFIVTLDRSVQDPDSKIVTYDLNVLSRIESDRVAIRWSVTGVGEMLSETNVVREVVRGDQFTESIQVRPRYYGRTEVVANITAYTAQGDLVAAARDQIVTDPELQVLPITEEYRQAQTVATIKNLLKFTAIILAALGIIAVLYSLLKKWLDKEATQY